MEMEKAISNYITCEKAFAEARKELATSIGNELAKRTARDIMCIPHYEETMAVYVFNIEDSEWERVVDEMYDLLETMEADKIVFITVHVYNSEETAHYYPEYAKKESEDVKRDK